MTDQLSAYERLCDPDGPARVTAWLTAPAGLAAATVAAQLRSLFGQDPDLEWIGIRVGGHEVGAASRRSLRRAEREAAFRGADGNWQLDPGEGGDLPIGVGRFQALHYRCPVTDCGRTDVMLRHSEDAPPRCQDGHGAMEYVGAR